MSLGINRVLICTPLLAGLLLTCCILTVHLETAEAAPNPRARSNSQGDRLEDLIELENEQSSNSQQSDGSDESMAELMQKLSRLDHLSKRFVTDW
uniref:Secreted protein n=2 Tax=Macrostomum lignano TaxID=282301 RepID=A0A1I8HE80_9PLAT